MNADMEIIYIICHFPPSRAQLVGVSEESVLEFLNQRTISPQKAFSLRLMPGVGWFS